MEIKSLKETDFGTICRAFGKAFADYELQLNDTQLQAMLTRRGYLPELSFGAFDGDERASGTICLKYCSIIQKRCLYTGTWGLR